MTTRKTIALTRQTFVGKVMTLLLNILSRLVIIFLPRSKCLLISWLQSPSAAMKWLCLYIQQINFLLYVHETRMFHNWKLAKCPRQLNLILYTWVQAMCWEDALEEEMATHSSIVVWRIPMDRGAWWATVHWVAKGQTWLKQLSLYALYILGVYGYNVYR